MNPLTKVLKPFRPPGGWPKTAAVKFVYLVKREGQEWQVYRVARGEKDVRVLVGTCATEQEADALAWELTGKMREEKT